jgi:hypothetical protein
MSKIWLPRWEIYGCECMKISLPGIEADMIKAGVLKRSLNFYQGSYHQGTSASKGTHDGGGVADTWPSQGGLAGTKAQKVWEANGDWDAYRYPPLFGYHNHLLWRGCPHMSPAAKAQINGAVGWGWNGLAGRSSGVNRAIVPALTWQQAYKKRHPPKPPTPVQKGLLGMTSEIVFDWPHPQKLANSKPTHLQIASKRSTVIGTRAPQAVVTAAVGVTGLKAGERVDLDWEVIYAAAGKANITRTIRFGRSILPGQAHGTIVWAGGIPASDKKGYDLRLRIRATAHAKAAVITTVQVRGMR